MVLAAMANPPEHDFAPSWLKIPSDQQKRGQKLGASDQWSGSSSKSGHHQQQHQQDDGGNKSRHRHYSSTDSSSNSSHPSGGYGRSPSSSSTSSGPPQGSYGYRGREPDRRHYPRPGSGSRHHSVDDLNGFHDYGGWNLPHYNGFYSNYPSRRGGSSTGPRDGPQHFGNSRYGDVFHQGGRGYYNNGGSGGNRGGSAGRQRYHSGSRAGYNDRDNQQDGSSSSHGGDDGHGDGSSKKKEGGEDVSKNSALSSNDFPSLVGDNSKSSDKDAAKTTNTPVGVWEKPPGAAKVQISGRKVQLIKKAIHNDLPPRDPSTNSSITSSSKTSSSINSEGSKVGGHIGSGTRASRPASSVSSSPSSSSSSSGGYKPLSAASQKASLAVKVNDSSGSSSTHISPKAISKDSNIHSPKSAPNPPKSTTRDIPQTKPPTMSPQQNKPYEKKAIPVDTSAANNKSTAKPGVGSMPESGFASTKTGATKPVESGFTSTKKEVSKAGPSKQTQANSNAAKSSDSTKSANGREPASKPVLVAVATTQKPATKQVSGKESPTKPVLVQATMTTSKPTIKSMSVKNGSGKPVLKESPVRPVPVQIKAAKLSGKESPIRPFPVRTQNSKQGNRDRSVRPGPVQIKSNRLVAKEAPPVRPLPVHIMTRKPTAAKDNPSDAVAMTTRSVTSSPSPKEKQMPSTGPFRVNTTSSLAKEPSTNPTSTPPVDIQTSRLSGLNKNVNNSDCTKGALKGLQNGGDNWANNGPLRIEDAAERMNGPQHSTLTEVNSVDVSTDRNPHLLTTNGLDNDLHSGKNNLQLSSSLEAEKRLLQEMGWHEHSDNEEGYAPITEDEMKEFQRRSQQLKRNGFSRSLPVALMSSSLPNTPMTSIDLDDALSSCSSDSSDDDL